MTFADVGDTLSLGKTGDPGLVIDGPFASGLGVGADNLVVRARNALLGFAGAAEIPLRLTKNLPLAAGIGGGSADAAATLRLAASKLGLKVGALFEIAASLGSDLPACLASQPVLATGRGDVLQPPPSFPDLHAVLVNPGVASPTTEAYRTYDDAPAPEGANCPRPEAPLRSAQETAAFLAACRNDLEAPVARLIQPVAETLAVLRRQPETLLARMSGSGATCFALVEDVGAANRLAARVAKEEPQWWVRSTALAGAP